MPFSIELQPRSREGQIAARVMEWPLRPPTASARLGVVGDRAVTMDQTLAHAHVSIGRRVDALERALSWLDAGRFGRCSICAGPIEAERLASDPAVAACLKCESMHAAKGWMLY